ncbi:hypothetical protein ABK040_000170 [Willaertia magna]
MQDQLHQLLFGDLFDDTSEVNEINNNTSNNNNQFNNKIYSENALSFLRRKKIDPIQTGIEPFDEIIGENKLPGNIIELYGNEGQGLTQTCYTLCCHLALPSHFKSLQFSNSSLHTKPREGYHVLYFDLDDKFDKFRVIEMIEFSIHKAFANYISKKEERQVSLDEINTEKLIELIFENENKYNAFMLDTLSRIHVIRVDNSFQLLMATEALIKRQSFDSFSNNNNNERVINNQTINHMNAYKAIIINSMTNFHKLYQSFDRKNWERAFENIIKLTNQKQIVTFVTIYDTYTIQSRRKYNQKKSNHIYQGANELYTDDKLANELVQLHRDVIKFSNWTKFVNYRLLFGGDYPLLGNGIKYCYLHNLNHNRNENNSYGNTFISNNQVNANNQKELYKLQILDYGTFYFK